jgi:basic amino acid/polyamine antiporter, APA family
VRPSTPPKELGFWTCTALVVGNTLGIGVFVLPASLAPYGLNALLGWAVTVAGILVIALVFARLARRWPDADGPYDYVRGTLGDTTAFVVLWCYWVSLWVANAAIGIGVGGYLSTMLGLSSPRAPVAFGLFVVWACVLVNLYGARAGGRVQVATTLLKLLPMGFVILLGAWVLLVEPGAYTRHVPTTPLSGAAVLAASTIALFALLGVEAATVPASRVRDPARTIPRATLAGAVVAAGVCIAISAVLLFLVPQDQLALSQAPFADLLERHSLPGSGRWLAAFVVISGLGALNGWTLVLGEVTHGLARHGAFPAALSVLNGRGAPARALLFGGLLTTAMVGLNFSRTLVEGFTFLSLVVTGAALPLYLACALALVWVARREVGAAVSRDYLLLGLAGAGYSLFAFVGMGAEAFLWALALGAAGLPIRGWTRSSVRSS